MLLSNAMNFFKSKYEKLVLNLSKPKTAPKTCWSFSFVNRSKIPLISPFLVNNEFVTDFLDKENLVNDFSENEVGLSKVAVLFLVIRTLEL